MPTYYFLLQIIMKSKYVQNYSTFYTHAFFLCLTACLLLLRLPYNTIKKDWNWKNIRKHQPHSQLLRNLIWCLFLFLLSCFVLHFIYKFFVSQKFLVNCLHATESLLCCALLVVHTYTVSATIQKKKIIKKYFK